MHIATVPTVTLIFAAALALLNIWLGLRVSRLRFSHKVAIGHGDDKAVEARMRAHANFNEYVPIALILMLLIELNVGPSRWLWGVGAVLVVARVLHPFGMDRPQPSPLRAGGALLTWLAMAALIVWTLLLAYGIRI
jgi:uncharacterized membrane protein YecN with MAPEG domain